MHQTIFETLNWYEALTLTERILILRGAEKDAFDHDLARRRLKRWRSQSPFNSNYYFSQRLSIDHLSEEGFIRLLGETTDQLSNRFSEPPGWLQEIERVYSNWIRADFSDKRSQSTEMGFLVIVKPLIDLGIERLRRGAEALRREHANAPFDSSSVDHLFLPNLLPQLARIVMRTMVLELNVARVQGLLKGQTAGERFQDYFNRLSNPAKALAILREYPVLARQLALCVNYWVANSLEFLSRLSVDWEKLTVLTGTECDPGALTEVAGGMGDTHREGRSVIIATFSSGLKVVYKPRSLAVDKHFSGLLTWINSCCIHPQFRVLKVMECVNYGWTEFVPAKVCNSPEELSRFYERLGACLGILFVLDATDIHHENLVASGEYPGMVDLESLFHPHITTLRGAPALEFSRRAIERSVLRVGLLPQQIWVNAEGEGIDISGMGGMEGQITPFPVLVSDHEGTDEMRFVRKRIEFGAGQNHPIWDGKTVGPEEYADEIINGFSTVYHLIVSHRDEFLADDGPLAAFANDEVRCLVRPTRIYGKILDESYHPNVLRSALDRDRLCDCLWIGLEHHPELMRLIPFEQADLKRGDIPYFACRPNSRHLWSCTGEQISDFLQGTSLNMVREKILALSEEDLSRQIWFIRGSLATTRETKPPVATIADAPHESTPANSDALIRAACLIGDQLEAIAYRSDEFISWTGLTMIQEKCWSILPVGTDLYSGLTGLSLYFAYLGEVTQIERYRKLAMLALNTASRKLDEACSLRSNKPFSVGAFSGESGLIYLLTHLGALWCDPELHEEAEVRLKLLEDSIELDRSFDILGGVAGYLCVLLNLYGHTSSSEALENALQCADHLHSNAQPMSQGVAWPTWGKISTAPLTGFSHGTAGIAYALLRLAYLTGEGRSRQLALDAIAYERSHFIPQEGNWRDLRKSAGTSGPMTAWCHGAMGIGLARLLGLSWVDDEEIRAEIEVALETTSRRGFGGNHSLCHGDLGNLELLMEASRLVEYSHWRDSAYQTAGTLLDFSQRYGWVCSTPNGIETPGLMLGLAGIGYGLLRLAAPEQVPSVLALQGPTQQLTVKGPMPD